MLVHRAGSAREEYYFPETFFSAEAHSPRLQAWGVLTARCTRRPEARPLPPESGRQPAVPVGRSRYYDEFFRAIRLVTLNNDEPTIHSAIVYAVSIILLNT